VTRSDREERNSRRNFVTQLAAPCSGAWGVIKLFELRHRPQGDQEFQPPFLSVAKDDKTALELCEAGYAADASGL
jgi:hypothetical protein